METRQGSLMKFIADLHVHSKYSRATSKKLDLENIYIAAQLKGISVVGTGDFTHPGWFSEIKEKLEPDGQGLFRLKKSLARVCDKEVPKTCRGTVRFLLQTEISNIYKKNEITRKNHNLVFLPDLETAVQFNRQLDKIGNIKSDGRPILGLDARNLLEVLLEVTDRGFLVPAHIWTPWFSLLGSKSGFDSLTECFEDLSHHIFAVETGLSSDPAMNWRVKSLDGLTLISNSDAHSPLKLGREANLFDTEISFSHIRSALETGNPDQFLGTIEFFPEEGKYHMDGHRKCGVRLRPEKSRQNNDRCPVCGKPLTLGVLYRVEELADRPTEEYPDKKHPFYNLIPLSDILSEIHGVGPATKTVQTTYKKLLGKLGPELKILHQLPPETIDKASLPLLTEAVRRMRAGKVEVSAGYDGEYGRISLFKTGEKEQLKGQTLLFIPPAPKKNNEIKIKNPAHGTLVKLKRSKKKSSSTPMFTDASKAQLNEAQQSAVAHPSGPLLIVAGPGTGKTLTLTRRISYLIDKGSCTPQQMLAVTFTNKAAREMHQRLTAILGSDHQLPLVTTFHGLCHRILNEIEAEKNNTLIDEDHRRDVLRDAVRWVAEKGTDTSGWQKNTDRRIMFAKQQMLGPDDIPRELERDNGKLFVPIYRAYQYLLSIQHLLDFDDLIFNVVQRLESDPWLCRRYRKQFSHLFVDEYQDLNLAQYRLVRALAPPEKSDTQLCVIGDPDQCIYGFRGSDSSYFNSFANDYAEAKVIRLVHNYRSTDTILAAASQVMESQSNPASDSDASRKVRTYSGISGLATIAVISAASDRSEADAIADTIEQAVGGTGFHSLDTGRILEPHTAAERAYSDFAVLYRTAHQHHLLAKALEKRGIPYQVASRENKMGSRDIVALLSLFRILHGRGAYVDLENSIPILPEGIGKKVLQYFKHWGFAGGYCMEEALARSRRFPIPGMSRAQQMKLYKVIGRLESLQGAVKELALSDQFNYLLSQTKLPADMNSRDNENEPLQHLLNLAGESGDRADDFLATLALQTDTDVYAWRAEKVALMTMHASKGLEFAVVFVAGCENGLIPFAHTESRSVDLEEERRLFYVAMTRAKEALFLSHAAKRQIYGETLDQCVSPFLTDIEESLRAESKPGTPRKKKQSQLGLFD
jgi:ATP-dependent DNA helicase UvrD/PcrA